MRQHIYIYIYIYIHTHIWFWCYIYIYIYIYTFSMVSLTFLNIYIYIPPLSKAFIDRLGVIYIYWMPCTPQTATVDASSWHNVQHYTNIILTRQPWHDLGMAWHIYNKKKKKALTGFKRWRLLAVNSSRVS